MRQPDTESTAIAFGPEAKATERARYEPPTAEIICMACEISAYAPDGDLPLF